MDACKQGLLHLIICIIADSIKAGVFFNGDGTASAYAHNKRHIFIAHHVGRTYTCSEIERSGLRIIQHDAKQSTFTLFLPNIVCEVGLCKPAVEECRSVRPLNRHRNGIIIILASRLIDNERQRSVRLTLNRHRIGVAEPFNGSCLSIVTYLLNALFTVLAGFLAIITVALGSSLHETKAIDATKTAAAKDFIKVNSCFFIRTKLIN